jgi:soluble lytic murein transglycosylase-like protein
MFDVEIQTAASRWNVPVSWIQAVIQTESSWNPNAYNASDPSGAYGLMQILFQTAQSLGYTGTAQGLFDPATNINLGTELLGQLRVRYGDDFRRVYSAYDSGSPDLWVTSEQVAANVARALSALLKYTQENPGSSVMVLAVLFLLAWVFRKIK